MLKKHILIVFTFIIAFNTLSLAQEKLTWRDFADVKFYREYKAKYGKNFLVPIFGEHIKSYVGKRITVTGYFLDFSGEEDFFLVSKNPMASCFFCGGAGPQTIIEVHFKKRPSFVTDQIITITGTLKLNGTDIDHCNYIFENATGKLY